MRPRKRGQLVIRQRGANFFGYLVVAAEDSIRTSGDYRDRP